jgi:glutathione S-transferase
MNLDSRHAVMRLLTRSKIILAESETIMDYVCDHFGSHMVPKRYPEGKEGVLGAETEEWMRHKVSYDHCV